jgi:hypothetical protein
MKRPLEEDFYTIDGTIEYDIQAHKLALDQYVTYILEATKTYIKFTIVCLKKNKPLLDFDAYLELQYKL